MICEDCGQPDGICPNCLRMHSPCIVDEDGTVGCEVCIELETDPTPHRDTATEDMLEEQPWD